MPILSDPSVMAPLLGAAVGLILALTGAGGGIIGVPLLVFGLGLPIQQAGPIGLLAVGLAAGLGSLLGLRQGILRYRAAALIGVCGLLTVPAGVFLAQRIPNQPLTLAFALLLAWTGWRALRRARPQPDSCRVGQRAPTVPAEPGCRTIRLESALRPRAWRNRPAEWPAERSAGRRRWLRHRPRAHPLLRSAGRERHRHLARRHDAGFGRWHRGGRGGRQHRLVPRPAFRRWRDRWPAARPCSCRALRRQTPAAELRRSLPDRRGLLIGRVVSAVV
jgi:hypothetical protein